MKAKYCKKTKKYSKKCNDCKGKCEGVGNLTGTNTTDLSNPNSEDMLTQVNDVKSSQTTVNYTNTNNGRTI
jgi:hypothetical protein